MTSCTNPKINLLLTRFELGLLNDHDRTCFEEHLLECDHCLADLQSNQPLISSLHNNRETIALELQKEEITFASQKQLLEKYTQTTKKERLTIAQRVDLFIRGPQKIIWAPAVLVLVCLLCVTLFKPFSPHYSEKYYAYLPKEPVPYSRETMRNPSLAGEQYYLDGMKKYSNTDYKGAIGFLKQAVVENPNEGSWWFFLGVSHYLNLQPKPAIEAILKAENLLGEPLKARARWYLALSYLLKGKEKEALPLLAALSAQKNGCAARADSLLLKIRPIIAEDRK